MLGLGLVTGGLSGVFNNLVFVLIFTIAVFLSEAISYLSLAFMPITVRNLRRRDPP